MSQTLVQFHLHHPFFKGKSINISIYDLSTNGSIVINMFSYDQKHWIAGIPIETSSKLEYFYFSKDESGKEHGEFGAPRKLALSNKNEIIIIHDDWKSAENPNNIFLSSAFKEIIFKRQKSKFKSLPIAKNNVFRFQLEIPNIPEKYDLGITGNKDWLGNWNKIFRLKASDYPIWKIDIEVPEIDIDVEYKYVLCEKGSDDIVYWETGANRNIAFTPPKYSGCRIIHTDRFFQYYGSVWKGAGVAIPVFSLRSKNGFGIGEFRDLHLMIDFACNTGLKVVQTLPVNDTIANKNWKDSYPYSAISVFALHPLYVNIEEIAPFKDKSIEKKYKKDLSALNKSDDIDFIHVQTKKLQYLNLIFEQEWESTVKSRKYKSFVKENSWLFSYASFCALREKFGTANFNDWPEQNVYDELLVRDYIFSDLSLTKEYDFYSFIQFHAQNQLIRAKEYGVSKGVVLKGDLPIGIYRNSCDAWIAPDLYNMQEQAGAPPDSYSVLGQNWGFPTYNWEIMAKDNYQWWQDRMVKLSHFFDALRIDHILGFFRIWQIPLQHIQGTLGLFNPRTPYTLSDLAEFGISENVYSYCIPELAEDFIIKSFGDSKERIIDLFLELKSSGIYRFKNEYPDQKTLLIGINESNDPAIIKNSKTILSLMAEVLLIEEPSSNASAYNPRITIQSTDRYQRLDGNKKQIFDRIYYDYYFVRHDDFWKEQALEKLPALLNATDMLICGEDLGMIPASVPEVMKKLNIIPLEIQRMPKGRTQFSITGMYPYFSVCSPSCHDMSTIRGWWEGDENTRQRFYNMYMNHYGNAPSVCDEWIVEFIIKDHLKSNSILAIFPIQDLLGMDGQLKRANSFEEQINDPSNSDQHWKFRMHLDLEDLINEEAFSKRIKSMIQESGRDGITF